MSDPKKPQEPLWKWLLNGQNERQLGYLGLPGACLVFYGIVVFCQVIAGSIPAVALLAGVALLVAGGFLVHVQLNVIRRRD